MVKMVEGCQIQNENEIQLFYVDVMRVLMADPLGGPDLPASFNYDIYAYEIGEPPNDPPVLKRLLDVRRGLKNGEGCIFTLPCGNYTWFVFAEKWLTLPGDPWEQRTRVNMQGTANVPPHTWFCGYLKFELATG